MTLVNSFWLHSEKDKRRFKLHLIDIIQVWSKNWFVSSPSIAVNVLTDEQIARCCSGDWLLLEGGRSDDWLAWKVESFTLRTIFDLMFTVKSGFTGNPTLLTKDILDGCVLDLFTDIHEILEVNTKNSELSQTQLNARRLGYGSGVVVVELNFGMIKQLIACGGGVLTKCKPQTKQDVSAEHLVNRVHVLGKYKTKLDIALGNVELTLGELSTLEVGDVIRLNTNIDFPLDVSASNGASIGKAFLGTLNQQKAIQIVGKNNE